MRMLVRVEFEINAANEDALYDRMDDLTYGMRNDADVSGYQEEVVDVD